MSKDYQLELELNKIICSSLEKIWTNLLLASVTLRQKRSKNSKVKKIRLVFKKQLISKK